MTDYRPIDRETIRSSASQLDNWAKYLSSSGNEFVAKALGLVRKDLESAMNYRFPSVHCSSCGESFGPGDEGFSHCSQHRHLIER